MKVYYLGRGRHPSRFQATERNYIVLYWDKWDDLPLFSSCYHPRGIQNKHFYGLFSKCPSTCIV